ncbi:hypothetical protein G9A89_018524 [Geosiphon pyriformis]|nr:hypothetical protein G9A89_018524 [Geosiphon pyriformis]
MMASNPSVIQDVVDSDASSNHICTAFFGARRSYHAVKLAESLRVKEMNIKSAINRRMKSFEVNKDYMIRSVLKHSFHKMVLDYLVVDDELILEPNLVMSKIDYVFDEAFFGVMCLIDFDELVEVVSDLPNSKAAGFLSISNKL